MNWDEDRVDSGNIDSIMEEANARTEVFCPRCIKCNSDLTDKEYYTKKCKKCGYNSRMSVRHCIREHYKGLPADLIQHMEEGFEI